MREADLFVQAEDMLVEVLGRIRPQDRAVALPGRYPGAGPDTMAAAVRSCVADDVQLARQLGASPPDADTVAEASTAACAAAREAPQDDSTAALLLRATVERSLLAHYVAAYLGSTACPLPEELARPLWELTAPEADDWRRRGHFRAPMPLPDHVSWRDRFLLTAGHEPHPLGH